MMTMASGAEPDSCPATIGVEAVAKMKNAAKNTERVLSRLKLRLMAMSRSPVPIVRAVFTHMESHVSPIHPAGEGKAIVMLLASGGTFPKSQAWNIMNTEAMTMSIATPRERMMRVKFTSLRVMRKCVGQTLFYFISFLRSAPMSRRKYLPSNSTAFAAA